MNEGVAFLISLVVQTLDTVQRGRPLVGLLIMTIIESPVVILLLASLFGHPRKPRVTGLFLGFLLMMFGGFIVVTYILGFIFGLFF